MEDQSPDIAHGVHVGREEEDIGAGDQGIMFGYATDETTECMPLTIVLAHKLNAKIAEYRRNGVLPWARPDTKTQVRKQIVFMYCVLTYINTARIILNTLLSTLIIKGRGQILPFHFDFDHRPYSILRAYTSSAKYICTTHTHAHMWITIYNSSTVRIKD